MSKIKRFLQKQPEMASGAVMESSSGPRPLLKGRHTLFMKKHLTIGLAYSFACVILTKLLVNEPRKKAYAEYYKKYDIEADFQRIRNLGYFQSCPADE